MINKANWRTIILEILKYNEKKLNTSLVLDSEILQEVEIMAQRTLEGFNQENPNVAKVASVLTFWIRKLKPIGYKNKKLKNKVLHINEIVSLMVGLSLCSRYIDGFNSNNITISSRVFNDWVNSLRVNSHSPHSSAISFELLTDKLGS